MITKHWFPGLDQEAWEQQELSFKENAVSYNGSNGDDDDKTDPGIGSSRGQSVMTGGCNSRPQANPASTYSDPNKRGNFVEIDRDKPRTYSYSWTPNGTEIGKNDNLPPPQNTTQLNQAAPSANRYDSGVVHDHYGQGGNHYTRQPSSSSYASSRDNFHSGSGMGYKPHEPAPPPEEVFVYDSTPGSVIRRIMERDGFLRRAKTEAKWKLIDINRGEFPAMLERGKIAVLGEVYKAVPRTLKMLDSMLDTPTTFRREIISLDDGTKAYAYVMPTYKIPACEISIDCGDWTSWKKSERERRRVSKIADEEKKKKDAEEGSVRRAREVEDRAKWLNQHSSSERNSKNPSKRRVHISTIIVMELRVMMHTNGVSTNNMDDKAVRVECIRRYGSWYLVDV